MTINQLLKSISGKSIRYITRNVCDEQIGSGLYREVYAVKGTKKYVIKIEKDPSLASFTNVLEWNNYTQNRLHANLSKWLAPCQAINETGQVLIQSRVTHKSKSEYPKKIPSIFTDRKITNFGWIGNNFVCCDYPTLLQNYNLKLRNARWRTL